MCYNVPTFLCVPAAVSRGGGAAALPALLVSHRRPGFYLRVLYECRVQAGDEIVQVAAGPEAMTVAEVDALLYLPGHPRQRVRRALRMPALPDGWKASFRAMLAQPETPGTAGNADLAAVLRELPEPQPRRLRLGGAFRRGGVGRSRLHTVTMAPPPDGHHHRMHWC